MPESTTEGKFRKRLQQLGYPKNQDTKQNGVIWYSQDSYKDSDKKLAKKFAKASKNLNGENSGRPDFTIDTDKGWIIVVECKKDVEKHSSKTRMEAYASGLGSADDIENYAVDGALHYASYVNDTKDVIAIGYSGTSEKNIRATSFVLPQHGKIEDIKLLEDGEFKNTIMTVDEYIKVAEDKLGRHKEENKKILDELSAYAIVTANYLRANKISAADRAGFISAVVLALTNKESMLYANTKTAIDLKNANKSKELNDLLGDQSITLLKNSLCDIWDNKDKVPKIKRDTLDEFYNRILVKSLLASPDGLDKCKKYYKYGDTVLSCCIYSVYENIIIPLEKADPSLDIMGTFYTVFLRHASGDAKDKGIVLTPKHVTELFCDIAELYLGKELDETTKVVDICCGTGGFLIAALTRMHENIERMSISSQEKKKKEKIITDTCLIGVENDPSMFALAYANMRFHRDGRSNLYSCSSLLKDSSEKGIVDHVNGKGISLKDELAEKNKGIKKDYDKKCKGLTISDKYYTDISVAMINPPYSTDSNTDKDKKEKQKGAAELDFVYSMLSYIKPGGIGIAIVPMSCAGNKGKKIREVILREHTLLACMTMPPKLFQESKVGTSTCIMVFRAHQPHDKSNKTVFLGRWLDDGFVTIPHNGRYDKNNKWEDIRQDWMSQLSNTAQGDPTKFMWKTLSSGMDEYLPEAYVETDYTKLTDTIFENELKKYALYKYMVENDLIGG